MKGINWNGSVLTYKKQKERDDELEKLTKDHVLLKRVYIDHVCGNGTGQNTYAVGSILELVFRWIRKEVPNLKRIIVETDNASCYANKFIPVFHRLYARIMD